MMLRFFPETLVSYDQQIKSLSAPWLGPSFWYPATGRQGGLCALFHPKFEGKVFHGVKIQVARFLVSYLIFLVVKLTLSVFTLRPIRAQILL